MKKQLKKLMVVLCVLTTLFGVMDVPFQKTASAHTTDRKTCMKQSKVTLQVGSMYTVPLKNKVKKAVYTYKTSNKKVATVSKNGKITAKKKGNTLISVYWKHNKKTTKLGALKVTVKANKINVSNSQANPKDQISNDANVVENHGVLGTTEELRSTEEPCNKEEPAVKDELIGDEETGNNEDLGNGDLDQEDPNNENLDNENPDNDETGNDDETGNIEEPAIKDDSENKVVANSILDLYLEVITSNCIFSVKNHNLKMIALDLTNVINLSDSEKTTLTQMVSERFGCEASMKTFKELRDEGLIVDLPMYDYIFEDGVLITLEDEELENQGFRFNMMNMRGGLFGMGYIGCKAIYANGNWTYTLGDKFIS